jgi:DNA-binding MarR family transcriptional regulator
MRTDHGSDGGLDPLELRAWRSFFEMCDQVRLGVERQLRADHGLSLAEYSVLVVLSEAADKRRRLSALCEDLRWDKSRLHHQIARMSRRGLVDRCPDAGSTGSRAVYIEITDAGLSAIVAAAPAHAREVRRLLTNHLDRQELERLVDIAAHVIVANCAELSA